MSYVFNDQEKAEIEAARLKSSPGDRPDAVNAEGNWVPFYTALSNLLQKHLAAGKLDEADQANFRSAKLWLDVAVGANGGTGMHSAFIRTYTDRQGELRRGSAFSNAEMQKASNGVALNLYRSIKGLDTPPGVVPWTVPSIDQIASADASSIGRNLFGAGSSQPLPADDDAIVSNSAWSGALGFSMLGGRAPYETWRLLNDNGEAQGQGTVNTLDDFKNLLYAVDSFTTGVAAGRASGGSDFINYLAASQHFAMTGEWPADNAGPLAAQFAIMVSSGNILGLVKDVAARTPGISPVVDAIVGVGPHKFLDMLMGAVQGKNLIGTTKTDAQFTTNARNFLGALTPTQLQSLKAELLPQSASAVAGKALANTPEGASARAALAALSMVSVQVSPEVAARVALYDPATGTGQLSESWIADRAAFTTRYYEQQQRGGGILQGSQNVAYIDMGNGSGTPAVQVLVGAGPTNGQRTQYVFGGSGDDQINGQGFADHLYGGAGADTLDGKGGADYLEGGAGKDVYRFNNEFGADTVWDVDGAGTLEFDGVAMPLATVKRYGTDDAWEDTGGQFLFTRLANASIAIKNIAMHPRTYCPGGRFEHYPVRRSRASGIPVFNPVHSNNEEEFHA